MSSSIYPLVIAPRYVGRIWGGQALETILGKPLPQNEPIGESWEIYEDNTILNGALGGKTLAEAREILGTTLMGHVAADKMFPLLTKLIDAHETLSVQVHPDNAAAQRLDHQPYGKTECWYVIHAEPGSTLTYGFNRDSSPEEYLALVADGTLDKILRPLPVQAGDVVYIPAGTVHAIGAGIIVYELQQTSDATYRIYDWNRKDASGQSRELNVDKARQVLDYRKAERGLVTSLALGENSDRQLIIAGDYFCQELVTIRAGETYKTQGSPVAICALDHPIRLMVDTSADEVHVPAYSSVLIPAAATNYHMASDDSSGAAKALVAYVPVSQHATRLELQGFGYNSTTIDNFLGQFAAASGLGKAPVPSA